jgi:hypothetical protein
MGKFHQWLTLSVMLGAVGVTCLPILAKRDSSETTCGPANWQTIVLFYILNYGAHAMTVVRLPGERDWDHFVAGLMALLLPFSGVYLAADRISHCMLGRTGALKRALYSGALCEVVTDHRGFRQDYRKIHGVISLPRGYWFRIVKEEIDLADEENGRTVRLACNTSRLQSMFAIIQLLYSCFTLYQTKGDQLQLYGSAAYGLTVIPYAVMSFVNLVAHFIIPQYPALFMVRTPTMVAAEAATEAAEEVGRFDGCITEITDDRRTPREEFPPFGTTLALCLFIFGAAMPPILYRCLSGFKGGTITTDAQRAWTLYWLISGQVCGFLMAGWKLQAHDDNGRLIDSPLHILFFVVASVPAIGGLVTVGQMLVVRGDCTG